MTNIAAISMRTILAAMLISNTTSPPHRTRCFINFLSLQVLLLLPLLVAIPGLFIDEWNFMQSTIYSSNTRCFVSRQSKPSVYHCALMLWHKRLISPLLHFILFLFTPVLYGILSMLILHAYIYLAENVDMFVVVFTYSITIKTNSWKK